MILKVKQKKPVSDKNHGFVVIADPQVWAGKEFSRLRSSVEDIKNEISGLNRPCMEYA